MRLKINQLEFCTKKLDNVKTKIHAVLIISKDSQKLINIMRIFQMFKNCIINLFSNYKIIS